MVDLAATLNPSDPPREPIPDRAPPRRGEPGEKRPDVMKFTYATGARPLDGYTIKRGIGAGGFGEVYYAVSDAGKEVALKRIQRHLDIELRGVSQCLNLKHPNLLSLYDIRYDDQGEAWVVMEYIVGDSLRDVLERYPSGLPHEDVDRWFRGLAAGVAYLHDHGIVHRDLKPGNVFLDDGMVKIGDYGLSKFISCSRRSGHTESVGTFHYMAPEIGRGSYGKQIDIYALGVMLYELISGKLPFEGESTQEIIMKHLTAEPDLSVLPPSYREVVRRALLKDPEKRFRNVGEMVQAMREGRRSHDEPFVVPLQAAAANHAIPVAAVRHDAEIVFGPVRHQAEAPAAAAAEVPPVLWQPSPRQAPGHATGHSEEPIAFAVRTGMRRTFEWWNDSNVSLGLRIAALVGVTVLLFYNMAWLVPLAMLLGCIYLVYFAIRATVLAVSDPPSQRAASSGAAVAAVDRGERKKSRLKGNDALRFALAHRPWRERVADLVGSMLSATVVASVLSFVALLLGPDSVAANLRSVSTFAWLLTTTLVASWSVLFLGKLWETSTGDVVSRRFTMLVAGLAVGLTCWLSHDFFHVTNAFSLIAKHLAHRSLEPQLMNSGHSEPLLSAYLLYFAAQFLLLRWWRQADSLRYSRLSLWDTAVCVFGAFLLGYVFPFWSPWGPLLAATISLTVQLSAGWVTPAQRGQIREQSIAA